MYEEYIIEQCINIKTISRAQSAGTLQCEDNR
jgi:hypothetical protein